jgi:HEAT repeat protein
MESRDRQHITIGRGVIDRLIESLSSKDGMERQRARTMLVQIGDPALESLIELLEDERQIARWEAARTLAALHDVRAAPALVRALEDEDGDVRWLAADALIGLQGLALAPLLEALAQPSTSVQLREGAHHVISRMRSGWLASVLQPVKEALEKIDQTELRVYNAARVALAALRPETDNDPSP